MGFFDSAASWISNNSDTLSTVVKAGQTAYSMYNQQQAAGTLRDATAPGGIVDPFGAERPQYQQKLSALYEDPSYLENLPGYKFQQQMGEQAVNRGAAKSGHFNAPNRLYELSKFNQGLASVSYDKEATRLAHLAGAGIQPNANAMLQGTEGMTNANTQTAAQGGGLLDTVLGIVGELDLDQTISGGGNPNANPTQDPVGPDQSAGSSSQLSPTTANSWEGLDAAYQVGGGAVERANELSGLTGNADMGGSSFANHYADQANFAGIGGYGDAAGLDPSLTRYQNTTDVANLSTTASAGFAGGGYLGSMAAKAITGSDDAASQYIGSTVGMIGSGAAMGALGVGGFASAGAGMAAAGAMAGPLLPVALVAMAYGSYQEGQAQSKSRKDLVGEFGLYSNIDWNTADAQRTVTPGKGSSIQPYQEDLYQWGAPNGNDYYMNRSVYDNIQSGDIDNRYQLYDKQGEHVGAWDNTFNMMKDQTALDQEELGRLHSERNEGKATKAEITRLGELQGLTVDTMNSQGYAAPTHSNDESGTWQSMASSQKANERGAAAH